MFLMDAEARFMVPMHAKKREGASHEPSILPPGFGELKFRGAQPPRLLFGAPSRRILVWRAYCFDRHPRTAMPTTRASSAAPGAGALPIPTESLSLRS